MSRQESFEQHYADQHDVPVESMAQYRWKDKGGYRLPGIAAAYRNYCAGWNAHAEIVGLKVCARPIMSIEHDWPGIKQEIQSEEFKGKHQ